MPKIPITPLTTAGLRINPIKYQAIFFDFDGVLVESVDIKTEAFQTLYRDQDAVTIQSIVEHHLAHEGISRVEKIEYFHRHHLDVELTQQELAVLAAQYSELVKDDVIACESVPGSLEFLNSTSGKLPIFVVSGTPEPELKDIIERRAMDGYFTSVHGSPRHKAPIVRDLLNDHGLEAQNCLFVGDAMTDYNAAADTNLQFLGRVGEGEHNPFPEGTTIIRDLWELSV